jgi:hypothetical protein
MVRWILYFFFADFVLLSAWATWEVGYLGIFAAALNGPGEMQIFADLCVALTFACGWLRADAAQRGVNPWPWVVAVLPTGSLALVAYVAATRTGLLGAPRPTPAAA